jgi:beta-N-acetylhexosaminidase
LDQGLRRLALGTLLAAFGGQTAPAWLLDLLGEGLAGVTLFATNMGALPTLTAQLTSARPRAIIAVDEEGGDVTRLGYRDGSAYPGNLALGVVDDPDLTRRVHAAVGSDLRAAGVTLNLAPVADVNTVSDNPVIGTRAFGDDPALVARHVAAAVIGLRSSGIAACAKHFPGHGATVKDSHLELPTVTATLDELSRRDLPPFAAAIDAGVDAVMTAHLRIPSLTATNPATFSRAVLHGLLRQRYAFSGTIITDALEMRGAVAVAGSLGQAAVRSLAAGSDLLCLGARMTRPLVEHVLTELLAAVADRTLPLSRLESAAARTAALASSSGPPPGAADLGLPTAAGPSPAELGFEAARRAVRAEGSLEGWENALIVQLHAGSTIVEDAVPWGLAPYLRVPPALDDPAFLPGAGAAGPAGVVVVAAGATSAEELGRRAGGRPIVVAGRRVYRPGAGRELIERLAAEHPVAVVEMGWPSAWRPDGVRVFVITHGAATPNARAAATLLGLPISTATAQSAGIVGPGPGNGRR